jgi:cytochrome c553
MNPKTLRTFVVAASCVAAPMVAQAADGTAPAGNPAEGAQRVQMCQGCHGIPGWRTAFPEVYSVPKIAGQHAAYLEKALHEYKDGERSHPSMRAIAASLSDKDIANLAAYYGQSGLAATVR